ncbi:MAG: DUF692 domain-containing protein [Myxococcales bacterium]|nr:DUF692 domain-containing protein [Myxococcales bacterium]
MRRGDLRLRRGATRRGDVSGVGLGLRFEFLDEVVGHIEAGTLTVREVPFFEIAPENYMRRGGHVHAALELVAAHFPLVCHGLHMSLGSVDAFDLEYFATLRGFLDRLAPSIHSDHLCFSGLGGRALHELLPLPLTEAAALHAAARIREAEDRLERPLAIENVSFYLELGRPEMSEVEFVSRVLEEADCGLLLDVNNVYVNSCNHGFNAVEYVARIEPSRVWQLHVAGHEYRADDGLVIDTHGAPVITPVYELMQQAVARIGRVPVVLERDTCVPTLELLLAERDQLQVAYEQALAQYRGEQGGERGA